MAAINGNGEGGGGRIMGGDGKREKEGVGGECTWVRIRVLWKGTLDPVW